MQLKILCISDFPVVCEVHLWICWNLFFTVLLYQPCDIVNLPASTSITSPIGTYKTGDAVRFTLYSDSTSLTFRVYTSVIGHLDILLHSVNYNESYINKPFTVCLPYGTYSIALVVENPSSAQLYVMLMEVDIMESADCTLEIDGAAAGKQSQSITPMRFCINTGLLKSCGIINSIYMSLWNAT